MRVLVVVLAAFLMASPLTWGDDDPRTWPAQFAAPDAAGAFETLRKVERDRRSDVAEPLFVAALDTIHPHLAVAAGDCLRVVGSAFANSKAFDESVRAVLDGRALARKRNLARILGAWGLPTFDGPLAALATKGSGVEEDALIAAGGVQVGPAQEFPLTQAALAASLEDKRPAVRMAGCLAAGRRKAKSLVPTLIRLVMSDDARFVGCCAVRALERMERTVGLKPFAAKLKGELKTASRESLLKAIVTLATIDDMDLLKDLLVSRDSAARRAALIALGRIALPTHYHRTPTPRSLADVPVDVQQAVTQRVSALLGEDDTDLRARASASRLLGRVSESVALPVARSLVGLMTSKDSGTSALALRACAQLRRTEAREGALEVAFHGPSEGLRALAAHALGEMDPAVATTTFVERLRSSRAPETAGRAIDALGFVHDAGSFSALLAAVKEGNVPKRHLERWNVAMERLTGHRFGADAAVWSEWAAKTSSVLIPRLPRPAWGPARAEAQAAGKLSPAAELVLERGLAWMDRVRRAQGFWSPAQDGLGGVIDHESTYTAVCLMALVGAGYRSDTGRYRETVWGAAEFLAATQRYDGTWESAEQEGKANWLGAGELTDLMHGVEVLGCVESFVASADLEFRGSAQRAVDGLVDAQSPASGWPSYFTRETTTCPTCLALYACATALAGGLDVPADCFYGGELRLRECTSDVSAFTERPKAWEAPIEAGLAASEDYRTHVTNLSMNASMKKERRAIRDLTVTDFGAAAWFLLGNARSHPRMLGLANTLMDGLPRWMEPPTNNPGMKWPWVHQWLGALAAHQAGGLVWRAWGGGITGQVVGHQRRDEPSLYGSWDSDVRIGDSGRLFATALCALALETWYRVPRRPPR